jgi:hypothetical protein
MAKSLWALGEVAHWLSVAVRRVASAAPSRSAETIDAVGAAESSNSRGASAGFPDQGEFL